MKMKRGVFFLANDRIIDLAIAFLNSFRKHNPDIPLCLIPFNSQCDNLVALSTVYGFTVFADEGILQQCDQASVSFHGDIVGQYRKIAAWSGEFDEFLYIDVDTIVLDTVEFAFQFLDGYDIIVSQSDEPYLRPFVWKDTMLDLGKLTGEQIAYSANTGFIVSKRGVISQDDVRQKLQAAVELRVHMELMCTEQPFLNYLIVTAGRPYTSLNSIRKARPDHDIPAEAWAGLKGIYIRCGRASQKYRGAPRLFLMHWAGEWQPKSRDRKIAALMNRFRAVKDTPVISYSMPYRKLWKYYRDLRPK